MPISEQEKECLKILKKIYVHNEVDHHDTGERQSMVDFTVREHDHAEKILYVIEHTILTKECYKKFLADIEKYRKEKNISTRWELTYLYDKIPKLNKKIKIDIKRILRTLESYNINSFRADTDSPVVEVYESIDSLNTLGIYSGKLINDKAEEFLLKPLGKACFEAPSIEKLLLKLVIEAAEKEDNKKKLIEDAKFYKAKEKHLFLSIDINSPIDIDEDSYDYFFEFSKACDVLDFPELPDYLDAFYLCWPHILLPNEYSYRLLKYHKNHGWTEENLKLPLQS